MADFQVKITTPVELEGAKQLEAQLERDIGKAKALGKAHDELAAKLATVKAAIAGAGESAQEAGKETDKLELSHRQLHGVLEQVAPGLAGMARFLTSGFAGAIGVVLIAFQYLNQKLEDFKKFLQDIDTGPGARGEWAERIRDNTREAAIATAVFNDRLEAAAKAQESLSKVTDRLIAIQKEQASAAKEVGDAQKELELSRLDLAEKLGQVTPEQAVKIKLEIDDRAFRRQLEAEKAAIQAELSARQQEWQANEQRGPGLAQEKDRLAARALADKNAADANAAKLKQDEENLKAAQDVLAKADERLLQPHHFGDRADTAARQYAETASRQAQEQIGLLNRSIQQEKGKQTPLETAAALSKEQFERAKKNYEDAAELERETERTIADLTARLAAQTAKADTLAAIHGQTTATKISAASVPHAPEDIAAQNAYANTPAGVMDPNFDWRAAILQMAGGNQADARLRALINELIGLARDIHLNKADRSAYEELAGEVANLRGQIQNSR